MHTSISTEAPRLPSLAFSDETVLVSKEVSIISSLMQQQSIIPEHGESDLTPEPTLSTGAAPVLNRWNSKLSENSLKLSGPNSVQRQGFKEPGPWDSNRESLKALADFLMTKEPPPSNFMSIASDEEKETLTSSALRLLGKKKTKKKKPQRFMKLPDSAIAASTRSGSRHIAISIPTEHDHVQESPRPPTPPTSSRPAVPPKPVAESRGTVTVLKPVQELQESASAQYSHEGQKTEPLPLSPLTANFSPSILVPLLTRDTPSVGGATPDSERTVSSSSTKHDPLRLSRSYVAVSPGEIDRLHPRQEGRESVGTVISQISTAASSRHTRGASSVSTAPTITAPPRSSSISHMRKSIQEEPGHASNLANEAPKENLLQEPPNSALRDSNLSNCSFVTSSTQPPELGVAVRGYDAFPVGRPQVIKNVPAKSPQSSSLPDTSKELPLLPGLVNLKQFPVHYLATPLSQNAFVQRPSSAPAVRTSACVEAPITTSSTEEPAAVWRAQPGRDDMEESIIATRQSRQERVKARKQRDMDSLRSRNGSRRLLADAPANEVNISKDPTQSQAVLTAPAHRTSKRRSKGHGKVPTPTMSPVMLVADLAPYTEFVTLSDLPLRISPIRDLKDQNRLSLKSPMPGVGSRGRHSHIPPAISLPPSTFSHYDSDSDVLPPTIISVSKRHSVTDSLRSSVLSSRREERRAKRNLGLKEQEMDARLNKLEQDNILLLQTLGGIARSFGTLGRVGMDRLEERRLVGRSKLSSDDIWSPSREEKRRAVDLMNTEPFMRELRTGPRYSGRGASASASANGDASAGRGSAWDRFKEEKEDYEEDEEGMSGKF